MMNEVLYMQIRLFRQFCDKYRLAAADANRLFNQCRIWQYIEECYDVLHLSGDELILNDVSRILSAKGICL